MMKKTNKLMTALNTVAFLAFATYSNQTFAATAGDGGVAIPSIKPKSGTLNITDLVQNLINFFLWAVGIVAFCYLVWGGILFVTAQGDSGKVKTARDTILYAIIGIIIAFAAIMILNFAAGAPTNSLNVLPE